MDLRVVWLCPAFRPVNLRHQLVNLEIYNIYKQMIVQYKSSNTVSNMEDSPTPIKRASLLISEAEKATTVV